MRLHLYFFAIAWMSGVSNLVFAKSTFTQDKQAEELCKIKAVKSAESIAGVNNPGSTQTKVTYLGVKKSKVEFLKSKESVPVAVFEVSTSFDDKTKTYQVDSEFSKDNQWCQVIQVKLTRIPQ